MPADYGPGPHHEQGTPPTLPEPGQHDPEDPVHIRQPRPGLARLPYRKLLPQRQVLERQLAVRAKTASQCPNEDSEPSDHDREIADQSAECKFIAPDDFLEGTPGSPCWWPSR